MINHYNKFYLLLFISAISFFYKINGMSHGEVAKHLQQAPPKSVFLAGARQKLFHELLTYEQRLQITRAFRDGIDNFEKNREFALKSYLWMEKNAPRVFSIQATFEIGEMFRDGLIGGTSNCTKAQEYFEKAIERAAEALVIIDKECRELDGPIRIKRIKEEHHKPFAHIHAEINEMIKHLIKNEKEPIMRTRALALLDLGCIYEESGKTSAALQVHLQAEKRIVSEEDHESIDDKKIRGKASLWLGRYHQRLQNISAMIRYYTYVVDVSDIPDQVKIQLCQFLADHGQKDVALRCLTRAAEFDGDKQTQVRACARLAQLGISQKGIKTAKEIATIRELLDRAINQDYCDDARKEALALLPQLAIMCSVSVI